MSIILFDNSLVLYLIISELSTILRDNLNENPNILLSLYDN